jgi:lipid II:glycine glycyltransferase (peptidoglycan interpeptide bridge formation enzyme)
MSDPYQTDEWASIKKEYGYRVLRVDRTYVYVKKTSLGDFVEVQYPNDGADAVRRALKDLKPISLSIFNDLSYSGQSFVEYGPARARVTCKVELTQSREQLWDDLKKQNRNAIRQGEKKGCEFRIGKTDKDFALFYSVYSNLAKSKSFSKISKPVMRTAFSSPISAVYLATVKGEPAAAAFVLLSDTVARFWYGAGSPNFYSYRPSNFLHWNIILDAKARGCTYYDLDGATPFKASFGGKTFNQEVITAEWRRSRIFRKLATIARR